MKTMAISHFKAQALKVLDQIARNHETLIITKRGKPIAQIVPYRDEAQQAEPGRLADTLVFEEDIVSPLGEEMWEAAA